MRVLLVYPGLDFEIAYPLGLAYVAAALEGAGHRVSGYDAGLDGMAGLGRVLEEQRPEVVGIAVWSPNRERAAAAARLAKRAGARVLIGGPHVTVDPRGALALTGADAAVVGEGEATAPQILAAWAAGRPLSEVPGAAWLTDGALAAGPPRPPAVDLDALPLADRRVFDAARYPHSWAARAPKAASLVTSRGCPRACAHCPSPSLYRGRGRQRSPAGVVAEGRAQAAAGVGHRLIEDEHPTAHRRGWLAICAALERARLGLSWSCPNGLRPETLDAEVLGAMARAGCARIALGVETPDPAQLARLGRHTPDDARRAAAAARAAGIEVTAYFMMGLPGDGPAAPLGLLREAAALRCSGAHFSLFEPLPGSAWEDQPRPAPYLSLVRTGLYAGFYAHPRRLAAALRASGASAADLPAALRRLGGWLRYGKRHAGLKQPG